MKFLQEFGICGAQVRAGATNPCVMQHVLIKLIGLTVMTSSRKLASNQIRHPELLVLHVRVISTSEVRQFHPCCGFFQIISVTNLGHENLSMVYTRCPPFFPFSLGQILSLQRLRFSPKRAWTL
jgi:hypothetical protein